MLQAVGFNMPFAAADAEGFFRCLAENPWQAAAASAALFFLKCLLPIIPMGLVYVACGLLLPPGKALFMCVFGNALCFTVSYFAGVKRRGRGIPLIAAISDGGKNGFFASFFLHCIRFFPCHTAGVYLGAAGLPFFEYLAGSLLGAMPTVILSLSVAGSFPHLSLGVWISLAAVAATTALGLVYLKCRRNGKK